MTNNCVSCSADDTPLPKSGTDCGITNQNPVESTGTCSLDDNGNPIVTPTVTATGPCVAKPSGLNCPPNNPCNYWELVKSPEACIIDAYIEEGLNIGGADLNVYRLLGVHEQGLLQDLVGLGTAISSGDIPNYEASKAFDKYISEWRSLQLGSDVVNKAYIGYDFGPIKLDNGRERYGIETFVKHDVTRIKIKQGCNTSNRVTKARIERSSDGEKWYGVAIVDFPDCDGLVTVDFKKTVPSRWWRIRPVKFNGSSTDYWSVQALQLIDYEVTSLNNIQDRIFLENRDLDYSETPVRIKGQYSPLDVNLAVLKQGAIFSDKYVIEVSFNQVISRLGRPFVIGDIIQLPSETQYNPALKPVLRYIQVDDVAWSTNGYTPTWVPTLQRLICSKAIASQETQDIFGKLTPKYDSTGLSDLDDGNSSTYQDYSDISQTIKADANTAVPQDGQDYANQQKLSQELLDYSKANPHMNLEKLDRIRNRYGIDALPPNGLPYTEDNNFPKNPKDGDYHRLTFTHIRQGIPARLYRYSVAKSKWIYLETDHRQKIHNGKSLLEEFKSPVTSSVTPTEDVDKTLQKNV